jgi:hypothetical protein
MPDSQRHRGAHPEDAEDFGPEAVPRLRVATEEFSYLVGRDYSDLSALKLVGDRHQLSARQRKAVQRAACSDHRLHDRLGKRVSASALTAQPLGVDGFNCLITLEAMLSGAPIFRGRDGVLRDLASVHGTYRRVEETRPALEAFGRLLTEVRPSAVHVFYDRPVGNSGRMRALTLEVFAALPFEVSVSLHDQVDRELVAACSLVASSDSWVLDHAVGWIDLAAAVAERERIELWRLDLG